jgi:hypothetical protein
MTRKRPDKPRIFCVGWHKTGTTTLGTALIELGYSVLGCRLDMVHPLSRGDVRTALEIAEDFDALQDVPWAALYPELDARFPGSRFILLERDESSWLKSAKRHFGETHIPLHEWLYGEGCLIGNEKIYLERYRAHNSEVRAYFNNRSNDLLVMNLERGYQWDELCQFLGESVPLRPFPHSNKGPSSYNMADKVKASIRRLTPMPIRQLVFCIRQFFRDLLGRPDPRNRFHNAHENRQEIQRYLYGRSRPR